MLILICLLASSSLGGIPTTPSDHESCGGDGRLSIKGLDRVQLLLELWICQERHGFSKYFPQAWSDKAAAEAVNGYIDYFQGRAIKMDLSQDCIDPYLYDRDTALKAIYTVTSLRRDLRVRETRDEM
jgi:hypothetical protein